MSNSSDPTAHFADDYFAARERFLSRTIDRGWTVRSHEIAAKGPSGEPLFIDVALRPGTGAAARRTVIVSSGLHGVEGFLGSAVQCAVLERLELGSVRDGVPVSAETGEGGPGSDGSPRLVFIHALNPFGFAWIRRCNEDNVDLNRNFPAPGNEYRGSPDDYGKLDGLLNKKSPPSPWEPFALLALMAIVRYGLPRLKRAIASGQYDFPYGLFYGGSSPRETTRFVQAEFEGWLGDESGEVLHLDFHTGLGPSGEFQLLVDVPPSERQAARIRALFGREMVAGVQEASVSYTARGSLGEWCQIAGRERNYQYLCVEFGTYAPTKVLTALRAENRAQHYDEPHSATYRWAKGLLKEAFCPSSPAWRKAAAGQGIDLVERAMESNP